MITLRLNDSAIKKINNEISNKVFALEELKSNYALQKIGEAAFTILATQFILDMSMAAKADRKKFENLYDWNTAGVNFAKKYTISRGQITGGRVTAILAASSNKGATTIPQQSPQSVLGSKVNISGKIITMNSKTVLANAQDSEAKVTKVPKTVVVNKNIPDSNSNPAQVLAVFGEAWFNNKSQSVMDKSDMFKVLNREISIALSDKNTRQAIKQKIASVSHLYSQGRTIF
jgi:hypothetical protein